MPYKDPEKRRAVQRESSRRKREGDPRPSRRPLPALQELRLESAKTAIAILAEQIRRVEDIVGDDPQLVMNKARTVASLITTGLRALEVGAVEDRLKALEDATNRGSRAFSYLGEDRFKGNDEELWERYFGKR